MQTIKFLPPNLWLHPVAFGVETLAEAPVVVWSWEGFNKSDYARRNVVHTVLLEFATVFHREQWK